MNSLSRNVQDEINVDGRAVGLVVLFAIVIGGALALRPTRVATGAEPAFAGSSASTQVAGGVIWAIAEAIFAGVLLLVILGWRRLPEWLQDALSTSGRAVVMMIIGAWGLTTGQFLLVLGTAIATITVGKTVDEFDLWWVVNNLLAIGIGIYVAVIAGIVLGPLVIAAGFIGLTAYDYLFADRTDLMFTLGAWTVRRRIPVLFIVPATLQLDWSTLADAMGGDDDTVDPDDLIRYGIGMADLALPAAFAVALVQNGGGLPLFGALAGLAIACTRVSHKIANGGGAGLPPIVSGMLSGWVLALLPGVIVAWI